MQGRGLLGVLQLALLFGSLGSATSSFAAFGAKDTSWEGLSGLVELAEAQLGERRVRVTRELHWAALSGADAVLVIHPEADLDFGQASAFLSAGGRLAIVDDFGKGAAVLERFHVSRAAVPLRPSRTLRDNPNLAIAVPATHNNGRDIARHPIAALANEVVTNHPSGLKPQARVDLTPVLEIPTTESDAMLLALVGVIGDARRCGLAEADDTARGVNQSEPCGRLFAMGDPSVFINLMLRYPGNRGLAQGLLNYLVEDDTWGKRNGKLYIVINDFSQTGKFPTRETPQQWLTQQLVKLSHLISRIRDDGLPDGLADALAALLALGLALTATRHVSQLRPTTRPRFADAVSFLAQGGPVGRVAVLSAKTTHRALAVLELKSALEEQLRGRLNLESNASPNAILERVTQQPEFGPTLAGKLKALFDEMSRAERAIVSSERIRVGVHDLEHLLARVQEVVTILEQNSAGLRQHAPSLRPLKGSNS